MKSVVFAALALFSAPLAVAQSSPTYRLVSVASVPTSPAALDALNAINEEFLWLGPQPAEFWAGRTPTQNTQMREDAQQKIRQLAVAFYRDHPRDPLRWVAIHTMLTTRPAFITGYKPGYDSASAGGPTYWIIDDDAKRAWDEQLTRYEAALEAADDVPWEVRERIAFLPLSRAVSDAAKAGPAAIGGAEKRIDAFAARFPSGRSALALYQTLFRPKLGAGGDLAEEIWGRLAANPNQIVVERAQAELRKIDAARKPLELTFTAVDGREVDLAKLRGKVVLIDFWATWCGPCIAELPNVKKVYEAYHEKGFEIVGITLEIARLATNDTPEQTASKIAAAKKLLTDFTEKNAMPWPQFFDGAFWKNPYVKQYAVTGIPAMFLLDQQGKVVSTNARGEKLEAEVKRLLQR